MEEVHDDIREIVLPTYQLETVADFHHADHIYCNSEYYEHKQKN